MFPRPRPFVPFGIDIPGAFPYTMGRRGAETPWAVRRRKCRGEDGDRPLRGAGPTKETPTGGEGYEAEVLAARFKDINPDIQLTVLPVFLKDDNIPELLDATRYDFVVDAIDTLAPKCYLIAEALKRHIKIVSSMGAGAKSDITQIRFADIWDTYHCGLSKAVRKRLQKLGIKRKLPVVFSTEQADPKAVLLTEDEQNKKSTCGTVSYMPAVFGCYLAEYVIKRL